MTFKKEKQKKNKQGFLLVSIRLHPAPASLHLSPPPQPPPLSVLPPSSSRTSPTKQKKMMLAIVTCDLFMCAPPAAIFPSICMIVNIVHGSVSWECTGSLSTNNGLSPLSLLSFPGAQRGMTLFPLLSPRILSSSRKTVGRNKGTATLIFFSPPYLLHTVTLTCAARAPARARRARLGERLCCHWLIIHYLCLLDVCICSSVCLGDTVRNQGTGSFPANEPTDLLLREG